MHHCILLCVKLGHFLTSCEILGRICRECCLDRKSREDWKGVVERYIIMCGSKSNHSLTLPRRIYESANLLGKYVKKGLYFFHIKEEVSTYFFWVSWVNLLSAVRSILLKDMLAISRHIQWMQQRVNYLGYKSFLLPFLFLGQIGEWNQLGSSFHWVVLKVLLTFLFSNFSMNESDFHRIYSWQKARS